MTYLLDYTIDPYDHSCLCDPDLADEIAPARQRALSLWFPAPPASATSTVLDVPGKFRLTDLKIN